MAWRFVRQPDGKLAVFSDVVDNFTHYDLDEAEAVDLCVSKGLTPREGLAKARAGLDDHEPWTANAKGNGHSRWDDGLSTVAKRHGVEAMREAVVEMGFPDYDVSGLDLTPYGEEGAPSSP